MHTDNSGTSIPILEKNLPWGLSKTFQNPAKVKLEDVQLRNLSCQNFPPLQKALKTSLRTSERMIFCMNLRLSLCVLFKAKTEFTMNQFILVSKPKN